MAEKYYQSTILSTIKNEVARMRKELRGTSKSRETHYLVGFTEFLKSREHLWNLPSADTLSARISKYPVDFNEKATREVAFFLPAHTLSPTRSCAAVSVVATGWDRYRAPPIVSSDCVRDFVTPLSLPS